MARRHPKNPLLARASACAVLAVAIAAAPGAAQVVFEGRVTDAAGRPLADVDLDFWDAQTGLRIDPSAPGWEGQEDKTDVFGRYEMVVKPEVYHVRYEPPPPRTDLAPVREENVVLGGDTVRDVTLPPGSRLSGVVSDAAGFPVANVDLDFRDPRTGGQLATSDDDTGPDGRYGTTVIPGTWDVVFEPPRGLGVAALQVDGVDLAGDAALDVTLPRGFLVTGRIESDAARPLANVDLDVVEPTGRRIPTSDDDTDASGAFVLNVPEGVFHLFAVAPAGLPFAAAALYEVTVDRSLDLGTIVLTPGVVVTGTVRDPDGVPIAGADLDLRQVGSCDVYPVASDFTDGDGAFALRVEPGAYDVVVNPPIGSLLPSYRFDAVDLSSDGVVHLAVPTWDPQTEEIAGRITDRSGQGLGGALLRGEPLGAGAAWTATTDRDGGFARTIVPDRYRIDVEPPPGAEVQALRLASVDLPCGLAPVIVLSPIVRVIPPARGVRAWPNPWGSAASIALDMTAAEPDATLEIFDVTGRKIRTLFRGPLSAGTTPLRWDGTNDQGHPVASGCYVLRLVSTRATLTHKITRIRRQ
jgi:hypothetical protein